MEDPKKIDAIIAKLKKETGSSSWKAAEGFHALMAVDAAAYGVNFNAGKGLIVKTFVNDDTGEVRTFYWNSVKKTIKLKSNGN
ncbi:MAG TPA: hypothetical protein VH234_06255 [Candidatus Saccharimonadales bacterium]|jgi:hypothetical protein|nr:hypothetical protein [Candidatus Saccharimonadales bacterium]